MTNAYLSYLKALELARSGTFTAKKKQEVLALLNDADKAGSHDAAYALATWHLFGVVVKKNYAKAVEYLERVANKVPAAAFDLAVCYEKGAGVEKNLQKAFRFYWQAATKGDADAHYEVG